MYMYARVSPVRVPAALPRPSAPPPPQQHRELQPTYQYTHTKALAARGDHYVICGVRDPEKMQRVAQELNLSPDVFTIRYLDVSRSSWVVDGMFAFVCACVSFFGGVG